MAAPAQALSVYSLSLIQNGDVVLPGFRVHACIRNHWL